VIISLFNWLIDCFLFKSSEQHFGYYHVENNFTSNKSCKSKSVTGICESFNLHRKNVYNGLGRKYVLWTDHQRQLHINCCSLEVLQVIFSCKICSNLYTWYTHLCPVELCMWLEYEVEQKAKICMSAQNTYIGKILLVM
jgi:hypothetical protein